MSCVSVSVSHPSLYRAKVIGKYPKAQNMQAAEHMQVLPRSPCASGLGSLCKLARTEKKKRKTERLEGGVQRPLAIL